MSAAEPSSELPGAVVPSQHSPSPDSDANPKKNDQEPVAGMVMREVVEELHMLMRSGPMVNPVLEKITPENITQLLESVERDNERAQERFKILHEERKEKRQLALQRHKVAEESRTGRNRWRLICSVVLAGLILFMVFGLSWLFLYYGQAQYIVAVLTGVGGFLGGLGVGRVARKSQEVPKEIPELAKRLE